ncbi:MAG TPA: hypothetical protein VGL73_03425 [Caulobacteraceae bacterium]|jgi:hypothetical protein
MSEFATFVGKTQSAEHIKPLHWYVACRLVLEGGFAPDDITPRPPFRVARRAGGYFLEYDPTIAGGGERTILGGLKTKSVDVVVTREGIGPVLAISCKGVTGALRNLTNRMEETIGECTNLHITYPALALGYLVLIRANVQQEIALAGAVPQSAGPTRQLAANDMALTVGGEPVAGIIRFHNALRELTGRRGVREDVSQYEAIAMSLVDMRRQHEGQAFDGFPPPGSPLRLEQFFSTLYLRYDERFLYSAPELASVTRRLEWAPNSPALVDLRRLAEIDYPVRLANS